MLQNGQILLILCFLYSALKAENTLYFLDQNQGVDGNGSYISPFNSFQSALTAIKTLAGNIAIINNYDFQQMNEEIYIEDKNEGIM